MRTAFGPGSPVARASAKAYQLVPSVVTMDRIALIDWWGSGWARWSATDQHIETGPTRFSGNPYPK